MTKTSRKVFRRVLALTLVLTLCISMATPCFATTVDGSEIGILKNEYVKATITDTTLTLKIDKKYLEEVSSVADSFVSDLVEVDLVNNPIGEFVGKEAKLDEAITFSGLKQNTKYAYRLALVKDGVVGEVTPVKNINFFTTKPTKPSKPSIKSIKVTSTKNLKNFRVYIPARWDFDETINEWTYRETVDRNYSGGKQVNVKVTLNKSLKKGEKLYIVAGSETVALDPMKKSKNSSKVYTGSINVTKSSKSAKVRCYVARLESIQTGESGGDPIYNKVQIQSKFTTKKTIKW